jgi:hypothetical protein
VHLPGEHAVNRFKLIIRNIPKARADDSGSDSQVIAAAIGRALNDGNGGRPPMQIRRSVGWNSGVVQSAFSSLVNRGHGSFRALNGRKSYGKESRVATSRRHVGVTGSAGRFDCANHLGSGGGLHAISRQRTLDSANQCVASVRAL